MRTAVENRFIILLIQIMRIAVESHLIIREINISGRFDRVNASCLIRNNDLKRGLYTRFNKNREYILINQNR